MADQQSYNGASVWTRRLFGACALVTFFGLLTAEFILDWAIKDVPISIYLLLVSVVFASTNPGFKVTSRILGRFLK